ncbi:uncharacterized protein BJ212DRAFT_1299881 [Suillus subaureus]|uniref:SAP domain-containing protein n=1 Tax=Suillus subaureus TaxID=48587 RepID=A0A9P7EAY0_9AGAM|nr:uncharacterized protein BJ212DRAFT_1299881 [Suillus subaureus]KAG1816032.1 hypothetical protein BJ212DRAFT_1299881 [Suillus subaureus]
MPESGDEELHLPILGQEYTPGRPIVTYQFLVTQRMTKADIQGKLKQYGRPVSGNQKEVLQRLRVFSEDEKEWLSLFQPKLKQKRREHTSHKTLSCKRVEDTFGVEPVQQTLEVLADLELTGSGSLHEQESFAVCSINNATAHVMDVKSLVCCSALSLVHENYVIPHQAQPMGPAAHTTTAVLLLSSQQVSSPHLDFHAIPQQFIPSAKLGIALLGDEQFKYDKTWVPELPTIHLSKDIDRLCEEWESSNLLCVGGRGIPVKYWDTASFWHVFIDGNGKRFSYQQILNCIMEQWTSAAAQDANNAHMFFGGDLNHPLAQGAFCYAKGSKMYLLSKDDAVAKKWHELLTTQPDILSATQAL